MSAEPDEILPEVFQLLRDRAGINPESLGNPGILHALRRRMAAAGSPSPRSYAQRLASDPAEFQELLEDLVVPETWWFRDRSTFQALAAHLDALRGSPEGIVRVLSVACSTGEEVYSLAIALHEAVLAPPRSWLLGTDVSRRSLELAKKGEYSSRSFREPDLPAGMRDRWCRRQDSSWQVSDELQAGVEFRWANLAQPDFLADEPPFQVIFCRNVLIYFDAKARARAVRHLHRLLSPEGVLWSASAEAPIFSEAGFSSLGRKCPFAFRREDRSVDAPRIAMPSGLQGAEPTRPQPNDSRLGAPATSRPSIPMAPWLSEGNDARTSANPAAVAEEASRRLLLQAAQRAADDGRLGEADALCNQVLSFNPANAEAHYLSGVVRQAQGMPQEARRSLEKALYLDPKHYRALLHLMLLAEQQGDHLAAANYRRRVQQAAPQEAP